MYPIFEILRNNPGVHKFDVEGHLSQIYAYTVCLQNVFEALVVQAQGYQSFFPGHIQLS